MTVLVTLRSKTFGKYLRLDANGVTAEVPSGGGVANTQTYVGTYETFKLVENSDGTVSFGSTVFQNAFLRLDGADVKAGDKLPGGGGTVNAQFGARTYERFKIIKKAASQGTYSGIVGIESNQFPGRYLRMDGNKNQVNVQGEFKTYEEWEILVVGRA